MTQEEKEEMTKELQRKMAQNLQFNYTTQEQAIKLLEIGVPKNSADGYYDSDGDLFVFNADRSAKEFFEKNPSYIPCWSVGRLEEIFDICDKDKLVLCFVNHIDGCLTACGQIRPLSAAQIELAAGVVCAPDADVGNQHVAGSLGVANGAECHTRQGMLEVKNGFARALAHRRVAGIEQIDGGLAAIGRKTKQVVCLVKRVRTGAFVRRVGMHGKAALYRHV